MFGGQGKVNSPSCSITQSEPRRDQEKSSNISGAFKSCGIPKTMAFNTKKLILDDLGCTPILGNFHIKCPMFFLVDGLDHLNDHTCPNTVGNAKRLVSERNCGFASA